MERAKVICHMYVTIDGKIVTDLKGYPDCEIAGNIYDEITFSTSNAWGCGSKTFAYLSNSTVQLDLYEPKQGPLEDHFVKDERYCFAFDRKGKLYFNQIYNDYGNQKSRFVYVLTKNVDKRFLSYLDDKGFSYLFCGTNELDLSLFLQKIKKLGIETFVLCGGAQINALFLNQDLVDEISLVVCPGIQGGRQELTFVGTHDVSLFPKYFKIKDVKILSNDTLYLNYIKK